MAAKAGADMLNGFGLLDASTVLSFEQLMLDYDIVTEILYLAKGIETNDDTIARDLIHEVGIGGTYLAKRHTLVHLKDVWEPTVFEYGTYEEWVKKGSADPVKRANDKVKALLKTAPSVPLEKETEKAIQDIVKKGEKDLK
jgi:trimethylamine--corrinoid protein Co-methyltransferase